MITRYKLVVYKVPISAFGDIDMVYSAPTTWPDSIKKKQSVGQLLLDRVKRNAEQIKDASKMKKKTRTTKEAKRLTNERSKKVKLSSTNKNKKFKSDRIFFLKKTNMPVFFKSHRTKNSKNRRPKAGKVQNAKTNKYLRKTQPIKKPNKKNYVLTSKKNKKQLIKKLNKVVTSKKKPKTVQPKTSGKKLLSKPKKDSSVKKSMNKKKTAKIIIKLGEKVQRVAKTLSKTLAQSTIKPVNDKGKASKTKYVKGKGKSSNAKSAKPANIVFMKSSISKLVADSQHKHKKSCTDYNKAGYTNRLAGLVSHMICLGKVSFGDRCPFNVSICRKEDFFVNHY